MKAVLCGKKGEVSPKQLQSKVKFDFVDNLEIKGTVIGLTVLSQNICHKLDLK